MEEVETIEINVPKRYNREKKLEIVNKIEKLQKKRYLAKFYKIIKKYDLEYTNNSNGIFLFFHKLDDKVYEEFENCINDIYKNRKKTHIDNLITSDVFENSDMFEVDKTLSNTERFIMKRRSYEKYLEQNQT